MRPMNPDPVNIVIGGVGGQGNILASQLLAVAATEAGLFATVGETYGASQRGGAVMSHVRISGSFQYGPLIPRRRAHAILGFEPLETLRLARNYTNPATSILFNTRPLYPVGVLSGKDTYPEMDEIVAELHRLTPRVRVIDAIELARQAGSARAVNMVMVGALVAAGTVPVGTAFFKQALNATFSGDKLRVNMYAFQAGLAAAESTEGIPVTPTNP